MELLTTANAKTVKGEALGYLTGILHLAPAKISGYDVCPASTAQCRKVCLYYAGRGHFTSTQKARIRKTRWLFEDREAFLQQLHADIKSLVRKAERMGLKPCVRLNGTSDLAWEQEKFGCIPQSFPSVVFYGYTKRLDIMRRSVTGLDNLNLVFSYTGANTDKCGYVLKTLKRNIAVVFDSTPVGKYFLGHEIIDGDFHDLRFLEPKPRVVGLLAKGPARCGAGRFVVSADGPLVTAAP